ncbi:unnamed protein product [Peronospora belbahrii]|uniref:Uncharacterized protein n=1 Tax=Peronospora belbahrii TaxID=622444 RepID=A0ABN8DEH4_9STRA|nr:unnamed protein product [Peronospora belbahrii]
MAATTSYPTNDVEERMPTSEISDAASSTSITKYIQPLLKSDSELKEEDLRNLAYYKMHNFMQIERLNMFDSPLFRRMIKLYNAEVRKYGVIKLAYRIEAEKRKSPNFMAMYEVAQFMTWLNFPHRRFFFVMKGFKFYGKKLYNTILENFRRFERTTKGS